MLGRANVEDCWSVSFRLQATESNRNIVLHILGYRTMRLTIFGSIDFQHCTLDARKLYP